MKRLILLLIALCLGTYSLTAQPQTANPAAAQAGQSTDKVRKGYRIPVFTLPSRDGGEKSFGGRSNRGRYTLIQYGATGCGYSLAAIKAMTRISERYADRLDVITVWSDPDKNTWLNVNTRHKESIVWTDLLDDGSVGKYFKIKIFPTFIVLGPDDEVIYTQKALRRKKGNLTLGKLKKVLENLN